jgi:hypothetical protein
MDKYHESQEARPLSLGAGFFSGCGKLFQKRVILYKKIQIFTKMG